MIYFFDNFLFLLEYQNSVIFYDHSIDDIDQQIAMEKSRRKAPKVDGLVGYLNDKIDSIRKAVEDDYEDDSGYLDDWDEGNSE